MSKDRLELEKFKHIGTEDISLIEKYLEKNQYETCDYSVVNLFAWGNFLNVRWRMYNDRILFFNFSSGLMLYPLGEPFSVSEITALSDMIKNDGFEGNFVSVPEKYLQSNPSLSEYFTPVYDEGNSDYLYMTENLAVLSGKKLQKKKNLISQFKRSYDPYKIEVFREEYIGLCIDLSITWCKGLNDTCDEDKQLELNVLDRAIKNHKILGIEGLLLFHKNDLIAFSLFSRLNPDTADIHFEKYDPAYKGAGQIINQETAIYLKDRYKFINREQDMGKEGLRKAKISYEPERVIPTYRLLRK